MSKLTKKDPQFYSKLSNMRKRKVGGQTFKDASKAREAGRKGGLKPKKLPKNVREEFLEDDIL